jgi:beta-galactosidase
MNDFKKNTFSADQTMFIGCAYYPEYWPESRWETDLKLMKQAGFNVVRMAEYSWVKLEPEEGVYCFDWLDKIIALCAKHDIVVILGTPTDSMPAWLARKYPDALAEKEDGTRVVWGGRKNNCYSSEAFNRLSKTIATVMAEHYKYNDTVIGWQIGNEYGPPESRSETQKLAFQKYLEEKYKTLDNLNEKWGNAFWGHTFTAWEDIPVPLYWRFNPSMSLEWKRFHTEQICRHQRDQIEVIRKANTNKFITHNLIGHHTVLDYPKVAQDIDFVSWDNYPIERSDSLLFKASLCGDLMRGIKKKNYWIMEQATGMISVMWEGMTWEQYRNAYDGELRKIAFQQIAHGADGILWFRWRAPHTGREQYLSGVLGQDGEPTRRFSDIAKASSDIRKIEKELIGTTPRAEVAIIFDYESDWVNMFTPVYKQNHYFDRILRYYKALFDAGVNVDVIRPGDDYGRYKLILAPDLVILRDQDATRLNDFVHNGGVLFADARTGEKDEYNAIHQRKLPGLLSQSLGIEIDDISCMYDDMEFNLKAFSGLYTAHQYYEWVKPVGAKPLGIFKESRMKGYAALTRNSHGSGEGWYLGTIVKEDSFYNGLINDLISSAGITPLLNTPEGVEVVSREDDQKKLLFLINHSEKPKTVKVPQGFTELISGKKTKKKIRIDRYDVAVIRMDKVNNMSIK